MTANKTSWRRQIFTTLGKVVNPGSMSGGEHHLEKWRQHLGIRQRFVSCQPRGVFCHAVDSLRLTADVIISTSLANKNQTWWKKQANDCLQSDYFNGCCLLKYPDIEMVFSHLPPTGWLESSTNIHTQTLHLKCWRRTNKNQTWHETLP